MLLSCCWERDQIMAQRREAGRLLVVDGGILAPRQGKPKGAPSFNFSSAFSFLHNVTSTTTSLYNFYPHDECLGS